MKNLILTSFFIIFQFFLYPQDYIYNGIKNINAKIGYTEKNENPKAKNCNELLNKGITTSGNYEIYPVSDSEPYTVYCDMESLGGGWTLFAYHRDNISKEESITAMTKENYGVVPDNIWLSLKQEVSQGIMLIDENDILTYASLNTLNAGNCYNLSGYNSPLNEIFILHQENSGCNRTGTDYSIVNIWSNKASSGAAIFQFGNLKMDVWNYPSDSSYQYQEEMYYYIK